MVICMNEHQLNYDVIPALQKHAKSRYWKKTDSHPEESDDDDESIMCLYERWYTELSDLSQWTDSRGGSSKQWFSNENKQKINIAYAIWEPRQRCSFLCCRIPEWNPEGVHPWVIVLSHLIAGIRRSAMLDVASTT